MKQIITSIICGIILLQFNSCFSSQAISKACYISSDKVYLKTDKIPDLTILATCNDADKATYEAITNKLQLSLKTNNIPSDVSFFSDQYTPENFVTAMKGNFQLVINPIKDEYIKDELNNPVLRKQILINLRRYSAQQLADIVVVIDRTENADKMGNQIADLVFKYLKKKKKLFQLSHILKCS
jgi:hypothetical protein